MHTLAPLVSSISIFIKKPKYKNIQKNQQEGEYCVVRIDYSESNSYKQVSWSPLNTAQPFYWVGRVFTFGYRNQIIILGVTPPVGISSSHYGALFIGLAKSNLLICFASCCSFKGSFALCRPFATCPYLLCRPSRFYRSTWWFVQIFQLLLTVSCRMMEDASMPPFRRVFSYRRQIII